MAQSYNDKDESERLVEHWKVRKLIKNLSEARGNRTSMISLILPPKGQIAQVSNMLLQEQGTASQIKSRVNRLSVLSAITSCRERLKLYNKVPPNGLVVFCGEVVTDEGKTKKLAIHFEPFKPLNKKLYMCDNKFHVDDLQKLLEGPVAYSACETVLGIIVINESDCLFATLDGNGHTIKHKLYSDIPRNRKGCRSRAITRRVRGLDGWIDLLEGYTYDSFNVDRFGCLRYDARKKYIQRIAEMATHQFISCDRPNVDGIILAGLGDLKIKLIGSDHFDPRLKPIVMKIVDTSYGGENGLQHAISKSMDVLDMKFVRQKRILMDYMQEIAQDNNKYCFGIRDTIRALEMGAIKTIIVWDQLKITRVTVVNSQKKEKEYLFLIDEELNYFQYGPGMISAYIRSNTSLNHLNVPDEIKFIIFDFMNDVKHCWSAASVITHRIDFLEWLAENYKCFGAQMEFVTNRSQEGAQFVKGLGGIGGFLRWYVNWSELEDSLGIDDDDDEAWI